jgi:D-3-phosphoglycerate dehydrogenase
MRVLIASKIDQEAIEAMSAEHDPVVRLGADEETLCEEIADCQALVFRSGVQINRRVIATGKDLQIIIRAGSGLDNIDLEAVKERGIRFVSVPGPGAKAVAELSFTLMLALARKLFWADAQWRAGHWVKPQISGRLLTGGVLGVVGAGNIGTRVGSLGHAWGMDVLGCVEHPTAEASDRLKAGGITLTDFETVMSKSDFVSVHVPLKESTRRLIGTEAIALMKPDAILVNMARGGVVDESALREALVDGRIAGAGLDVHEVEGEGNRSPLVDLENVILTPHIGSNALDSQREIGEIVLKFLDEAATKPPPLIPGTEDFHVVGA